MLFIFRLFWYVNEITRWLKTVVKTIHSRSSVVYRMARAQTHTHTHMVKETESLRSFQNRSVPFRSIKQRIMIIVGCPKSLHNNNNRHNDLRSFTQPYHFHILCFMLLGVQPNQMCAFVHWTIFLLKICQHTHIYANDRKEQNRSYSWTNCRSQ